MSQIIRKETAEKLAETYKLPYPFTMDDVLKVEYFTAKQHLDLIRLVRYAQRNTPKTVQP